MIKRENPSSVHMVTMSVVLSVPTPRVLIPVVHKKSQGPGKLAHVLCFQVEADPDFRQVGVQGPEPGREKAGSWQFSSRTEQGELICSHSGLSTNTSAVRLGGRFRASEVHQANLFSIQKRILGLLSLGSVGVVFSAVCFWPCHEACRALVP